MSHVATRRAEAVRGSSARQRGGGRAVLTALIVVAVAVAMLLIVRARPGVEEFDPRSSSPTGTNGAVLLLRSVGATVEISSRPPRAGDDERVLVVVDRLDDDQRRDLLDFVDAGGVAVVADPASDLHGGGAAADGAVPVSGDPADASLGGGGGGRLPAATEADVVTGDCDIAALRSLRGVFVASGLLFAHDPAGDGAGGSHCFGDGEHSFVVVRTVGRGAIVGFGDNHVITNRYLRYADNSGLLTALLAPADGAVVRVLLSSAAPAAASDVGTGDESLIDLVRPGVWMGLTQLTLAFIVFCLARGVRSGRTPREFAPTPIAGSEIVSATGNLMQRASHHQHAGWLLRAELYRQLVAHHRAPADISVDRLSRLVATRCRCNETELRDLLMEDTIGTGGGSAALVHLSLAIERMRHATIDATRAARAEDGPRADMFVPTAFAPPDADAAAVVGASIGPPR